MMYVLFLVPVIIFVSGFLMYKNPPKNINVFVGYRTKKSMKNKNNWEKANKRCGELFIKSSVILTLISVVLCILNSLNILKLTENIISLITLLQLVPIVIVTFIVDKELGKKKNNKKKINISLIICIVLFGIFFIYKLFMLYKYTCVQIDFNKEKIFNEKVVISDKVDLSGDRLHFEEISFKNYFDEYKDSDGNSDIKVKYGNDGKIEKFYSISKEKQYIDILSLNSISLYTEEDSKINFDTDESMRRILKNNNIKDDIDFLRFIKDNYYIKSNILMSDSEIKNNFIINTFVEVALPAFESVSLVEGNLNGYIINLSGGNIKEIHLVNDGYRYVILLGGEDNVDEKFITKLLETISFTN